MKNILKKVFYTQTDKVYSKEYGWLERVRFYINLYFWQVNVLTQHNPFEVLPQVTEPRHLADLEEYAMYLEWREKCHLNYVENHEFLKMLEQF